MDSNELQFILKMRDEASAVIKAHGAVVEGAAGGYKKLGDGAKEAGTGLQSLVNKSKEAAEAVAAVWAASEIWKETVGAFEKVEVSMVRLREAAGDTEEGMRSLQSGIEAIAATSLDATAAQLDKVALTAVQLGAKGHEAVLAFTKTVTDMGTVSGMSANQVATSVSKILGATGEGVAGAQKFGDAFAVLQEHTIGGGKALLQTAQQISMSTQGFKISSVQVAGLASAFDNLNLRARSGAMAFSQVLNIMGKAAEEGGYKLQDLAKATGLTMDQFKAMMQSDPTQVFTLLVGSIKKLQDSGGNVHTFLSEFGLDNRMIATTLTAAAKKSDEFKKSLDAATNANPGTLAEKVEKMLDTINGAVHEAEVTFESFRESLGEAVSPQVITTFHGLSAVLSAVTAAFKALPEGAKAVIADLLIFTPIVIAMTTAWKFLTEVVMTGVASYRSMWGVMGEVTKAAQFLRVAEADVAEATESATVALNEQTAAMTRTADEAVVLGDAEIAAGAKTEAAMVGATAKVGLLSTAFGKLVGVVAAISIGEMIGNGISSAINNMMPKVANAIAEWRDNSAIGSAIKGAASMIGVTTPDDINRHHATAEEKKVNDAAAKDTPQVDAAADAADKQRQTWVDLVASGEKLVSTYDKVTDKAQKLDLAQKQLDALKAVPAAERPASMDDAHLAAIQEQIKAAREALDPMQKFRDDQKDALEKAQAITKAQQDQLEIEKKIADLQGKNPNMTDAQEDEVRASMRQAQLASIQKSYEEQMQTIARATQATAALTEEDKQRLEIANKIADAVKKEGFSQEQLDGYKQALQIQQKLNEMTATQDHLDPRAKATADYNNQVRILNETLAAGGISANKYNEELTRLNAETLDARDPFAAQVKSIQDEIDKMEIVGKYAEADRLTQEQINKLKEQGVAVTKQEADALQQVNRTMQEINKPTNGFGQWAQGIKDAQGQLVDLEKSFSSGLSEAITGALEGKKGNFSKLAVSMGEQMTKAGVDMMMKQGMQAIGLAPDPKAQAATLAAALAKEKAANAAGQAADAAKNVPPAGSMLQAATMQVTATTVNVNGAQAMSNPQAGANTATPGATSNPSLFAQTPANTNSAPTDVNVAAVNGTALTSPAIPFVPPDTGAQITAGTTAMGAGLPALAAGGAAVGAGAGLFGIGGPNYTAVSSTTMGGVPSFAPGVTPEAQGAAFGFGGIGLGMRAAVPRTGSGYGVNPYAAADTSPIARDLATGGMGFDQDAMRQQFGQGQLGSPFKNAVQFGGQQLPGINSFGATAFGYTPSNQNQPSSMDLSTQLIARRERFIPDARRDNGGAFRTGYGSDTTTDDRGNVRPVTPETTVSQADAMRDLQRRTQISQTTASGQIGQQDWNKLDPNSQAALTSNAYNYGHLQSGVVGAAQTGNKEAIAAALEAQKNQNEGVNSNRRQEEADIVRGQKDVNGRPVRPGGQQQPSAVSQLNDPAVKQAKESQKQLQDVQQQGTQQQIAAAKKAQTDQLQATTQAGQQQTQATKASAQQQLATVQTSGQQTATSYQQTGQQVQTAGQAAQTAGPQFQQAGTAIQQAGTSATSAGSDASGFGSSIAGLAGPLASGKAGMASFAQSALSMVTKLLSSGGSGGGGLLGGLFGGMHAGGMVGSSNMYSTSHFVSPSIFASARRFHTGLNTDEYPAILQRSERVLTANDNQRTTNALGQMADSLEAFQARAATGGGNNGSRITNARQTFNINTPDAGSFRKSAGQVMSDAHVHMTRMSNRNN